MSASSGAAAVAATHVPAPSLRGPLELSVRSFFGVGSRWVRHTCVLSSACGAFINLYAADATISSTPGNDNLLDVDADWLFDASNNINSSVAGSKSPRRRFSVSSTSSSAANASSSSADRQSRGRSHARSRNNGGGFTIADDPIYRINLLPTTVVSPESSSSSKKSPFRWVFEIADTKHTYVAITKNPLALHPKPCQWKRVVLQAPSQTALLTWVNAIQRVLDSLRIDHIPMQVHMTTGTSASANSSAASLLANVRRRSSTTRSINSRKGSASQDNIRPVIEHRQMLQITDGTTPSAAQEQQRTVESAAPSAAVAAAANRPAPQRSSNIRAIAGPPQEEYFKLSSYRAPDDNPLEYQARRSQRLQPQPQQLRSNSTSYAPSTHSVPEEEIEGIIGGGGGGGAGGSEIGYPARSRSYGDIYGADTTDAHGQRLQPGSTALTRFNSDRRLSPFSQATHSADNRMVPHNNRNVQSMPPGGLPVRSRPKSIFLPATEASRRLLIEASNTMSDASSTTNGGSPLVSVSHMLTQGSWRDGADNMSTVSAPAAVPLSAPPPQQMLPPPPSSPSPRYQHHQPVPPSPLHSAFLPPAAPSDTHRASYNQHHFVSGIRGDRSSVNSNASSTAGGRPPSTVLTMSSRLNPAGIARAPSPLAQQRLLQQRRQSQSYQSDGHYLPFDMMPMPALPPPTALPPLPQTLPLTPPPVQQQQQQQHPLTPESPHSQTGAKYSPDAVIHAPTPRALAPGVAHSLQNARPADRSSAALSATMDDMLADLDTTIDVLRAGTPRPPSVDLTVPVAADPSAFMAPPPSSVAHAMAAYIPIPPLPAIAEVPSPQFEEHLVDFVNQRADIRRMEEAETATIYREDDTASDQNDMTLTEDLQQPDAAAPAAEEPFPPSPALSASAELASLPTPAPTVIDTPTADLSPVPTPAPAAAFAPKSPTIPSLAPADARRSVDASAAVEESDAPLAYLRRRLRPVGAAAPKLGITFSNAASVPAAVATDSPAASVRSFDLSTENVASSDAPLRQRSGSANSATIRTPRMPAAHLDKRE
ncbi:hypothetical protein RI367_006800 [Sorochytrium milnesiophthora]